MPAKICRHCRGLGFLGASGAEGIRCSACNPAPSTAIPAEVVEKARVKALRDYRRCNKGVAACRIPEDRHGWETERSYFQGAMHALGKLLGLNR